jgi:hypothetical protein
MFKRLEKLMQVWQKRLRLQDWDIKLQVTHMVDMPVPDALGCIGSSAEHKSAVLTLLNPDEYPDGPFPVDTEEVLVHELLHLHTIPFRRNGRAASVAEDAAIECIAPALVEGWRKK